MRLLPLIICFISITTFAQEMTEKEVSNMCLNQILAGMVDDKIIGADSGICVKLNKDINGNIQGMDFNMKSDAFDSGSNAIAKEETKARLASIQKFILDYQKTVTGKTDLSIDDIDIKVSSYADGLGGPLRYDDEIQAMAQTGKLRSYISSDMKSSGVLGNKVPAKKFDYKSLSNADKSIIRNIVLAKKRSIAICEQLGQSNCDKKQNTGFASTQLEKTKKDCPERRVSLIRVDLGKIASKGNESQAEFHPSFQIPHDAGPEGGEDLKQDMELAAAFDMVKTHREIINTYFKPDGSYTKAYNDERQAALAKNDMATVYMYNSLRRDPNSFTLLDIPATARKKPNALANVIMMTGFWPKYERLKKSLSADAALINSMEGGDFISFKTKVDGMPAGPQKKAILDQLKLFTQKDQNTLSTDYFNFYSSGQAIQYSIKKHAGDYAQTADKVMNSSGGTLKIVMKGEDVKVKPTWDKNKPQIPRLPWQCHGGCDTGIQQNAEGSFVTSFRDNRLRPLSTSAVTDLYGAKPTSFGALKALNVYTIKNCPACGCLTQPGKSLDTILNEPGVIKTSIDKFTKDAKGKESFSKDVGVIEKPEETCIFTPPVAHTCKQDPQGKSTGHPNQKNHTNFSCPFWHKKVGLEKTVNFVLDVLKVQDSGNASDQCRQKVKTFEETIKTGNAVCEKSIPAEVPEACK